MYTRNSNGPDKLPWGTTLVKYINLYTCSLFNIDESSLKLCFIFLDFFLSVNNEVFYLKYSSNNDSVKCIIKKKFHDMQ